VLRSALGARVLRGSVVTPSRDAVRMTPLAVLALGPLAVLPLVSLFVVGSWALGREPFASTPALTLSEAAATRDGGEVLRLIEQEGADPNRTYRVRAGILRGEAESLLSLEAAVASRRAEIVR